MFYSTYFLTKHLIRHYLHFTDSETEATNHYQSPYRLGKNPNSEASLVHRGLQHPGSCPPLHTSFTFTSMVSFLPPCLPTFTNVVSHSLQEHLPCSLSSFSLLETHSSYLFHKYLLAIELAASYIMWHSWLSQAQPLSPLNFWNTKLSWKQNSVLIFCVTCAWHERGVTIGI